MRKYLGLVSGVVMAVLACGTAAKADVVEDAWMAHMRYLADDALLGRASGTPGYDRAAEYVANAFSKMGLKPAGTQGYMQPVEFKEFTIDRKASHLMIVADDENIPLDLTTDFLPLAGRNLEGAFEAPLVFIGYGLHIPDAGHDDFANVDLRGKVAVVVDAKPQNIPANLAVHARNANLLHALERAGALGVITLSDPEISKRAWDRFRDMLMQPDVRLADLALLNNSNRFVRGIMAPDKGEFLFRKSDLSVGRIWKLAAAGQRLPSEELNVTLRGEIIEQGRDFTSANVVGMLPGSKSANASEYVVLTAHLDHIGLGGEVHGDNIYNGAMDNASGVASMIEVGRKLARDRPKRSIIFLAVTAEEHGLLGSRYFSLRPTVPTNAMIANINMDMYLPLWPFNNVVAIGAEESSLGQISEAVAKKMKVNQVKDRRPEQNFFVRSDQYSFVRVGVPAIALKFAPGTERQRILEASWMSRRYHMPSDDLEQPINPSYAVKFNRYLEALIREVADQPERPKWNADSFFKRYATAQ